MRMRRHHWKGSSKLCVSTKQSQRDHLVLRATRLDDLAKIKAEVSDIQRSRGQLGPAAMRLDAWKGSDLKGKGKDLDVDDTVPMCSSQGNKYTIVMVDSCDAVFACPEWCTAGVEAPCPLLIPWKVPMRVSSGTARAKGCGICFLIVQGGTLRGSKRETLDVVSDVNGRTLECRSDPRQVSNSTTPQDLVPRDHHYQGVLELLEASQSKFQRVHYQHRTLMVDHRKNRNLHKLGKFQTTPAKKKLGCMLSAIYPDALRTGRRRGRWTSDTTPGIEISRVAGCMDECGHTIVNLRSDAEHSTTTRHRTGRSMCAQYNTRDNSMGITSEYNTIGVVERAKRSIGERVRIMRLCLGA
eukprot:4418050-Amphidinium_carterae.8